MRLISKFVGKAIAACILLSGTLSACQPKVEPVKPNAEQQALLTRLYKNCKSAVTTTPSGKLKNLAKYRKSDVYFTCEEMKQLCENDYVNDQCQAMITVASIENAFHKACRTRQQSSACRKVDVCNIKGFESPECLSAVKPFNR